MSIEIFIAFAAIVISAWSAREASRAARHTGVLTTLESERRSEEREASARADLRVFVRTNELHLSVVLVNLGPAPAESVTGKIADPATGITWIGAEEFKVALLLPGHELPLRSRLTPPLPQALVATVAWTDGSGSRRQELPIRVHPPRGHVDLVRVELRGAEGNGTRTAQLRVENKGMQPVTDVDVEFRIGGQPFDTARAERINGRDAWMPEATTDMSGPIRVMADFTDANGYRWRRIDDGRLEQLA